jgi:putative tryptophan/tyrosine transport system substrate-binding protein
MRRRKFIELLGAASAWPLTAVAQQPTMPVIGYLNVASLETTRPYVAAFQIGLADTGFVEGRNLAIEYQWGQGHNDRLPTLIAELVRLRVSVIAIMGSTTGALIAKAATETIPIVFLQGADPVRIGLVSSLNHPGGNITGISLFLAEVAAKRFGLLLELVPSAGSIGYLYNPSNPVFAESEKKETQTAADALRVRLLPVAATRQTEIEPAFERLVEERVDALFVSSDGYLLAQSDEIVARAASRRLPAVYAYHEAAAVGGLVSYGTNLAKSYRQAGVYTGRILKGEKPSDLPVTQPTSIDLAINLKTAKALDLAVPLTLLAQADEVIE